MTGLDAYASAAAVRQRELSPVELVEECLSPVHELDGKINAFTVVLEERARAAPRGIERRLAAAILWDRWRESHSPSSITSGCWASS
jgi:Asp-tRNA(Asn)/Glu-tRNA(Gln) amidotransferase A subunit family amidase